MHRFALSRIKMRPFYFETYSNSPYETAVLPEEKTMDFRKYYHLESYLFDEVRPRFLEQGYLTAFDFFCIVIWKANRSKSNIARMLLEYERV